MTTLTNELEKHKGGPILYMVNNENNGPVGSIKPLSLGDLWYGMDDLVSVMEGCLDMVEELEEYSGPYEFRAPLLMMRQTLKFGLDRVGELAPYADKRGRDIHAAEAPDGQKTIGYHEAPSKVGTHKQPKDDQ